MTVSESVSVSLSTLGILVALLRAGATMTRGGKLLSTRGIVAVRDLTASDGPFMFGIMDKSIDLAQLTAYLENDGPVSPNEVAKREIASRGAQIRTLGRLEPSGSGTSCVTYLNNVSLSGLKFSEEGAGWTYWIYNVGPAMTTGATFVVALQHFVEFNPSG